MRKVCCQYCFQQIKGDKRQYANNGSGEWRRMCDQTVLECTADIADENTADTGEKDEKGLLPKNVAKYAHERCGNQICP